MLIDEIIDMLSDENSSLSNILLKTNVLLHRIGKKDLAEWVTYELEGYPKHIDVPEYRKLPARVVGNAASIAYRFDSHPIPIMHLSKDWQESLSHTIFCEPLNTLEELSKGDSVSRPLPLEICPMLSKGLVKGTEVSSASCSTSPTAIKGTLMKIRAKLLNFLLNLKDSLGDDIQESEMKDKASKIDTNTMFRDTIFGSNATVIIGNNNNPTIHNVVQNDFESLSLKDYLK